jgi:hypothetical protein
MHRFRERCLVLCARLYWVATRLTARYLLLPFLFRLWRTRHARRVAPPVRCTPLSQLQLNPRQLADVTTRLQSRSHVVLGELDRDSLLRSLIGSIPGVCDVTDDFQPRRHTRVQLVVTADGVGVRKYHQNRWRFLCELRALHTLEATGCRVPSILDADFAELATTSTYVPGTVLTERLATRSSGIRDRDVETSAGYEGLRGRKAWNARIQEGNRVLYETVARDFGRDVRQQLERIHAARVIWGDVKFGNIVVESGTGRPWLLDFDYAAHLPRLWDPLFRALCREEIAYYERHFGDDTRCFGEDCAGSPPPVENRRGPSCGPERELWARWPDRGAVPAARSAARNTGDRPKDLPGASRAEPLAGSGAR